MNRVFIRLLIASALWLPPAFAQVPGAQTSLLPTAPLPTPAELANRCVVEDFDHGPERNDRNAGCAHNRLCRVV